MDTTFFTKSNLLLYLIRRCKFNLNKLPLNTLWTYTVLYYFSKSYYSHLFVQILIQIHVLIDHMWYMVVSSEQVLDLFISVTLNTVDWLSIIIYTAGCYATSLLIILHITMTWLYHELHLSIARFWLLHHTCVCPSPINFNIDR